MAGVRRFQDLVAWQLAAELRERIDAAAKARHALADERYWRQLQSAAASTPANLAEGFVRYSAADFARFTGIARSSLAETQNHLDHGRAAGYLSEIESRQLFALSCRAMAAIARLHRYLQSRAKKRRPSR